MEIEDYEIEGPLLITPKKFGDSRGFFVERYNKERFAEIGVKADFIQDNFSRSAAGILRGLHYQYDEPQSKLVTCLNGCIEDIVVDIRSNSPTYGKHLKFVLEADNPQWIWVPSGFAHGFSVMSSQGADVMYKVDVPYNPRGEGAIRFDDKDLNIQWSTSSPKLSEKDTNAMSFSDYTAQSKF